MARGREAALPLARAGVQDQQLRSLTDVLARRLPEAPRTVTLMPDGPKLLQARRQVIDEEQGEPWTGGWIRAKYHASSSEDRTQITDGRLFGGAVTGDAVAQSSAFR